MKTWYIYALVDPRSKEVRYIGKSEDPIRRLDDHMSDQHSRLRKSRWLKKLGCRPILRILDQGQGSGWQESERWWIKFYREEVGADLTNLTEGGEGMLGIKFSAESRAKMAVRKGAHLSDDTREKIRKANLGKTGHKHSDESKKRMSDHRSTHPTLVKWLESMSPKDRNEFQVRAITARWSRRKSCQ